MDVEAASIKQAAKARLGVDSQKKIKSTVAVSAKDRLGLDSKKKTTTSVARVASKTSTTKPVTSRLTLPDRRDSSTGVKQRIGAVKSNVVVVSSKSNHRSSTVSKTSSVFSRLAITKK